MKFLKLFLFLSVVFFSNQSAYSQSLADIKQDLDMFRREVGNLRLEVEQLTRDNQALQKQITALKSSSSDTSAVNSQIAVIRAEIATENATLKKDIIEILKRDIQNLASQSNKAINDLATDINRNAATTTVTKTFNNDFPQTGFNYIVKSGDTLSKIARDYKSKVSWIQNANRIADPNRGLRVGDEIYIPQAN